MMYEKSKEYPHYSYVTFNTEGYAYGYAELVCDEAGDIDYLPTAKGDIAIGSTCLCLENGKTYTLSNERVWTELVDGSSEQTQEIVGAEELQMAIDQGGIAWNNSKVIYQGNLLHDTPVTISPAVLEMSPDVSYTLSWGGVLITATAAVSKDGLYVIWSRLDNHDNRYLLEYDIFNNTNIIMQTDAKAADWSGTVTFVDCHPISYELLPEESKPFYVPFRGTTSDPFCDVEFNEIAQAFEAGRQIIAFYRQSGGLQGASTQHYLNMHVNQYIGAVTGFAFYGFIDATCVVACEITHNGTLSISTTTLATA